MVRLRSADLNQAFVASLGDAVVQVDDVAAPVLTLELAPPLPTLLRVYMFNATNPPGGRVSPEHKIQLMVPGQRKGDRANFDISGGRSVLMVGKVEDLDAFVLWDASLYRDFPHSRNVQVRTATIEAAIASGAIRTQPRQLRLGAETVIVSPSDLLGEAIRLRVHPGGVPAAPAPAIPAPRPAAATGGRAYVAPPRTEPGPAQTIVFEVDPDAIDRSTTAHKDIQDALAEVIAERGLVALSPEAGDPQFDIAWVHDDVAYVTEVKSLTDENEERQLRLGLGQVLTYVHLLDWPHTIAARAVLAVERPPTAEYWTALCAENDVILTWPGAFGDVFVHEP